MIGAQPQKPFIYVPCILVLKRFVEIQLIIIVRLEFSPQDRTLPNILSTVP